jgi:hypothetical protein
LFDATNLRPWQASASQSGNPVPPASSSARIGWAKLLATVFAIDVTVCRRCGGALRIAAITDADEIARLLHGARPAATLRASAALVVLALLPVNLRTGAATMSPTISLVLPAGEHRIALISRDSTGRVDATGLVYNRSCQ